jgi:hypothetical protein
LLGSFGGIHWDTGGATLDLTKELVGQPTGGSPWGTAGKLCAGNAGDFNLVTYSGSGPDGVICFTLGADRGAADAMVLTTMAAPNAASVPTLSRFALLPLAAVTALAAAWALRRPT